MIDWFFYIFTILTLGFLALAYFRKSFAFGLLGVVLLMLMGATLNGEGIARREGTNISCDANCMDCNTSMIYTTYTIENNTWMWTLGFILMWGGFAGLIGLSGLAIKSGRGR